MGVTDTNQEVLNLLVTDFGYDLNSDEIVNLDLIDALAYEPPVSLKKNKSLHDPVKTGKVSVTVSTSSFKPSRVIFSVPAQVDTPKIGIYNLKGRLVRSLSVTRNNRNISIVWDGKNEQGVRVRSGTYAVKLSAGKNSMSKKLVLTR